MTQQFFGEYLVENKIISPEQLVRALVTQIEEMPTIAKIVAEEKWIKAEHLIQIFHLQHSMHLDFISASQQLGYWNQEIQDKASDLIKSVRLPIGQILVDQGAIDLKKLTHGLDEYLSKQAPAQKQSPAPVPTSHQTPVVEDKKEVSESIKPDDKSLQEEDDFIIQPPLLMELEELFDERKKRVVTIALSLIKDNTKNDSETALKLYRDIIKCLKPVSGLCGMLGLMDIVNAFNCAELKISERLDYAQESNFYEKNLELSPLILQMLSAVWSLRESVLKEGTSKVYFKDPKNRAHFDQCLKLLDDFK